LVARPDTFRYQVFRLAQGPTIHCLCACERNVRDKDR
jgi:hypothetical protein